MLYSWKLCPRLNKMIALMRTHNVTESQ